MTRTIYRSSEGHHAVREWCDRRLQAADVATRIIRTSLGLTHITAAGTGPPLVLLPGTNFATATWLELLTTLSRNQHVVGLDLPGQPGLSAETRPRDPDSYGRWFQEVVTSLGLDRPLVVGHSLGGRVALLAARNNSSLGGIVLVNPAGLVRLRVSPEVLAATIRWLARRDETSAAALLQHMSAPGAQIPGELVSWMTLIGRHVRTSLAPAPLPRGVLSAVRCPVWLVAGRHDPFLPARRLTESLNHLGALTTATVVETAGHLLPEEAPDEVVQAIKAAVAP